MMAVTRALIAALLYTASLTATPIWLAATDDSPTRYVAYTNDRYDTTLIPGISIGRISPIGDVSDAAAALLLQQMRAPDVAPLLLAELTQAAWTILDPATPILGSSAQLASAAISGATALAGDYSTLDAFRVFVSLASPFPGTGAGANAGISMANQLAWPEPPTADTPEPAALALTGAGLVLLGLRRRCKRVLKLWNWPNDLRVRELPEVLRHG